MNYYIKSRKKNTATSLALVCCSVFAITTAMASGRGEEDLKGLEGETDLSVTIRPQPKGTNQHTGGSGAAKAAREARRGQNRDLEIYGIAFSSSTTPPTEEEEEALAKIREEKERKRQLGSKAKYLGVNSEMDDRRFEQYKNTEDSAPTDTATATVATTDES